MTAQYVPIRRVKMVDDFTMINLSELRDETRHVRKYVSDLTARSVLVGDGYYRCGDHRC